MFFVTHDGYSYKRPQDVEVASGLKTHLKFRVASRDVTIFMDQSCYFVGTLGFVKFLKLS